MNFRSFFPSVKIGQIPSNHSTPCVNIGGNNNNSEVAKKARLEKPQLNHSRRRETVLTQQDYFNEFDSVKNGKLHVQTWAKSNISKFDSSITYSVSHCTVCHEGWPLKSKPRSPDTYVC